MGNVVKFETLSTEKQSEWIDRLFARLWAMYGNKFSQMWVGQDINAVKSVWREDLAEFTPNEIAHGVDACKTHDWPPSLPEFVKLCRPGIDYERAYYDAAQQLTLRTNNRDVWPFAALYWAAQTMAYEIGSLPYSANVKRWRKALDDALAGIKSGALPDTVPERKDALPAPGKTTPDQETVRANLEKIKSMVGLTASAKTINKDAA